MSSNLSLNLSARPSDSPQAGSFTHILPVTPIQRRLQRAKIRRKVSPRCGNFVSAALEYLIAEIGAISGDLAVSAGRDVIKPKHIKAAIMEDAEVRTLLKGVSIRGGPLHSFN